jgi:hypothetical protein
LIELKTLIAMKKRFLPYLAFAVLACAPAFAATQSQWPECDCPDALKVTLASWDFENLTSGQFVPSAPASYVYPDIIASDLTGPGNMMATAPDANQWGCFPGFPDNGSPGIIGFHLQYNCSDLIELCGFSFDVFSEGDAQGLHGPTSLFVNIFANGNQVWQSETLSLTPGISNQVHWDISNPDGNELNLDGISFTGGDFSWLTLNQGDILAFEIVAAGANSSTAGLHLDNVNVLACVPEPSSALLLMAAGMVVLIRFRRSRLA